MIRSMTGFGRGEAATEEIRIQVDVRSVNHRFLDLNIRLPKALMPLEGEIREMLKSTFTRGHIDAIVNFQRFGASVGEVNVNLGLAQSYHQALSDLAAQLGLPNQASIAEIVNKPGVLDIVETDADLDTVKPVALTALEHALAKMQQMRVNEGEALAADLRSLIHQVREQVRQLIAVVPQVQAEANEKFRQKAAQWAGEVGLDPTRLHQEAAFLLAKMDVHEELSRLQTHLEQMEKYLDAGEPVGKRLDFLMQELHREITTCGNKVQGLAISEKTVTIKGLVEKLREQIQNVE